MIRVVILMGRTKKMLERWEGKTSKRQRIFLSKTKDGFVKAQVLEGSKKFPFFYFVHLVSPREILWTLEEVRRLLKRTQDLGKEEVVILVSRQDHDLMKAILPGKERGRYHLTEQGWLVVFKGGIYEKDVCEFVSKFFKADMIAPSIKYEELDHSLHCAKQRFIGKENFQ